MQHDGTGKEEIKKGKDGINRDLEGLVEELALLEAHPPLVGLCVAGAVDDVEETDISLLTDLLDVRAEEVGLTLVGRGGAETAEAEGAVAGHCEGLDGKGIEDLVSLALGLVGDLVEAGADVERDIDEETICIAAHLVVAEEDVRLEETDRLVDDVLAVASHRGCRSLELGRAANRKNRNLAHVATLGIGNGLALGARLIERRVISTHCHLR